MPFSQLSQDEAESDKELSNLPAFASLVDTDPGSLDHSDQRKGTVFLSLAYLHFVSVILRHLQLLHSLTSRSLPCCDQSVKTKAETNLNIT